MRKRGYISHETELAAALLMYRDQDGNPWVRHEDAKLMSAEQVISLFERHHNVLHAHDGPDEFWNIMWVPFLLHRQRTREIDVPLAAKVKRLREAHAAHEHYRATGDEPVATKRVRKIPSRPMQSRPFKRSI